MAIHCAPGGDPRAVPGSSGGSGAGRVRSFVTCTGGGHGMESVGDGAELLVGESVLEGGSSHVGAPEILAGEQ